MKNRLSLKVQLAIFLVSLIAISQATSNLVTVFPEKTYKGSFSSSLTVNESIAASSDSLLNDFTINLKNADGKPHLIVPCSGNLIQKLLCGANNLAQILYKELFRVEYVELYWNGQKVVSKTNFNQEVALLSVSVKSTGSNVMQIKYKGLPTAFFSVGITRPAAPEDKTAPVILTQLKNDSFTNQKSVAVQIQDVSNVTSSVLINGSVVLTSNLKSFNFELLSGLNNIEIRSVDQHGNSSSPLLISNVVLDQVGPSISLSSNDSVFVKSLPNSFQISLLSNEILKSMQINGSNHPLDEDGRPTQYSLNVTLSGAVALNLRSEDRAGNISEQSLNINVILDSQLPVISFGVQSGVLTNQSLYVVPVSIAEQYDVHSIIKVNDVDVLRTGAKEFSFEANLLLEGENSIQVISTDIAGNEAQSAVIKIVRDMTPPVLSNINPQNNRRIDRLAFVVSGVSNEILSEVSVNGLALKLDNSGKSFSGNYVAAQNGTESLSFTAKDLAGNTVQLSSSVQIDNRLVIPELISIVPNSDREHLNIVGAAGSVRSNVAVSASAGILGFNSDSGESGSDGSFVLKLTPFTSAKLKVKDSQNNEEITLDLNYEIVTRLSGLVKDTQGNPLPGATVRISSNNSSVLTDGSGVFNINSPMIGDQTLTVDGATIPQSVTGANRKFSVTKIQINIGLGQENVLERPIFLAPLYLDGSETNVVSGQGATVTNPAAPGVQLDIPSNSTVFPTGGGNGAINIAAIEADKATVPVPQNIVPKNVVALEPSGLKFSTRVPVTLPNDYDLPAGVEMFILSMDSTKGTWSVDGTAVVTEDGSSIKTKDGEGISHFSLIYAIPAKPIIAAVDNPKLGGVDISQGSLTTKITLPSWKSLGVDIVPSLIYKSNWANPTAYVSNYIDVPKQEFTISKENSASSSEIKGIKGRYCEKLLMVTIRCYNTYDEYVLSAEAKDTLDITSWYQPESIKSQFFVGNLTSGPIQFIDNTTQDYNLPGADPNAILPGPVFTGGFGSGIVNYTGIPNRSLISYAVPLKNNSTGEYLSSGIYPTLTRFELRIKNMILRSTTSYRASSRIFYDSKFAEYNQSNVTYTSETTKTSSVLDQVFPSDVVSPILVQNKVKSAAGRGWHLGLTQNILSPNSNKILLEEASGELATYAVNNTISSLYNSTNTGVDTNYAFDYSQFPKVVGVSRDTAKNNYLVELDLSQPNPTPVALGKIPQIEGGVPYNALESGECIDNESDIVSNRFYTYKSQAQLKGIVRNANGDIYAVNSLEHSLISFKNGVFAKPIGATGQTRDYQPDFNAVPDYSIDYFCIAVSGDKCEKHMMSPYQCSSVYCNPKGGCSGYPKDVAFGQYPTYNSAGIMNPSSLVVAPDGILVITSTGNNMVKKVDLVNNTVTVIAGDGSNLDQGDGVPALQGKIFHPLSAVYDNNGNLYILTQNGYIRKVDVNGMMTHFGGVPPAQGGAVFEAPFKSMPLYQPSDMVFDNVNQYLYVADTGNHRIVRFDLNTEVASTIAGTGSCNTSQVNDNVAALNSNLCSPKHLGLDASQNLVFVDTGHNRIRKINFNYSNTGTLAFSPNSKDGSVLYRYNDKTWSRVLRNGTVTYFNANGQQLKSVDRIGNEMSYAYNSDGNLDRITDPVGQVTYFNYSGGLLSSIQDPAGRTTSFNYSFGNLTSVNFPDGASQSFEYNNNGLLTKEINQRGNAKKYSYNEYNRLASVTDELEKTVVINDVVSGSMSNNYTGENTGQLNNQGSSHLQLHDRIVDAKEIATEITKDFNGQIVKIKDGAGQITSLEKNLEGDTKKIIFPDLSMITFDYDPITNDVLKIAESSTNSSESQTYNIYGQVTSRTDSKGFKYLKQYNQSTGLLEKETLPNSQESLYTYNSKGQVSSVKRNPSSTVSVVTYFDYDNFGNRNKVILPEGKIVAFVHDQAGNTIKKIVHTSSTSQDITSYEYNSMNQLIKVISPRSEVTEYNYLPTGQLSLIKDAVGNVTTFEYDKKGLLIKRTEPNEKVYSFAYDPNGNLVTEIDPNGNSKRYSVDALNRVAKIVLPDDEINFSYSTKGEILQVSNNISSVSQIYDAKGKVASSMISTNSLINYPSVKVDYTFDVNGNRDTLRSSVLNLNYVYDQSNRLTNISDSSGNNFGFDYDYSNRLVRVSRPGSQTNLLYNSANQIDSLIHSSASGTIDSNAFSFDSRNLPTQKRTIAGSFNYSYDSDGQLTSAIGPELNESYSYDSLGNRLSDHNGSYSYDSTKRLIAQDHSYFYTHDQNGNLIGKFSKAPEGDKVNYLYTSLNQIKEIRVSSHSDVTKKIIKYFYDPRGRRIAKTVIDSSNNSNSFTRFYVYDQEKVISEHDGDGNLLVSHTHSVFGPDDVLASKVTLQGSQAGIAASSGKYFYLKDNLGTVTSVTDETGAIVQKYQYSPFGKIIRIFDAANSDITSNPVFRSSFTFQGREFDGESGLYFYRARTYDPNNGRFLQKDPDPGNLKIPSTVTNSYTFLKNSPTTGTDSSGKNFLQDLGRIIVIGVAVVAAVYVGAIVAAYFGVSGVVGAILGAAAGAAVGGIIGGLGYTAFGLGTFGDGFLAGAIGGGIAGGLAGYGVFSGAGNSNIFGNYEYKVTAKNAAAALEPWGQYGITFNYDLIPYLQTAEAIIVGAGGSLYIGYQAYALDQGAYVETGKRTVYTF